MTKKRDRYLKWALSRIQMLERLLYIVICFRLYAGLLDYQKYFNCRFPGHWNGLLKVSLDEQKSFSEQEQSEPVYCAICTVKVVPNFPNLHPMASCISSLCPAWEREGLEALVESEAERTCWLGCEPSQSHIWGPREPGPPFAILAGESHRQIWREKNSGMATW